MFSYRKFYRELAFLERDYNFKFVAQFKGIDERYIFEKDNFQIVYFIRTSQFENLRFFYYSIYGRETIINIEEEFFRLFKKKSFKNCFWKLGVIIKEQLKDNRIFNYHYFH